jgi:hypothetical protein
MILNLLLPFQTLLEKKEMTENDHVKTTSEGHPEGAVDLEVMKITSENMMTSNGLGTMENVPRESTDDTNQGGGAKV